MQDQEKELYEARIELDTSDWRNEVKIELEGKANLDDVKQTLDHVAETMEDKLGRADVSGLLTAYVKGDDLLGELEVRPTKAEVSRWLEHKAEAADLRAEVRSLQDRLDRLAGDLGAVQASSASVADLSSLKDRVERKVDAEVFREAIKRCVLTDEFQDALAKKADLDEVEELMEKKVDGQDLNQIIAVIEKKADADFVEDLYELVKLKAEAKDVEMLSVGLNKKADRKACEETGDQLTSLRKEVQSMLEEFDQAFTDMKALMEKNRQDLETCSKEIARRATKAEFSETKTLLGKRVETSLFIEELTKIKEEISREQKTSKAEAEKVILSHTVQKVD
jgi:hypothetical protein